MNDTVFGVHIGWGVARMTPEEFQQSLHSWRDVVYIMEGNSSQGFSICNLGATPMPQEGEEKKGEQDG